MSRCLTELEPAKATSSETDLLRNIPRLLEILAYILHLQDPASTTPANHEQAISELSTSAALAAIETVEALPFVISQKEATTSSATLPIRSSGVPKKTLTAPSTSKSDSVTNTKEEIFVPEWGKGNSYVVNKDPILLWVISPSGATEAVMVYQTMTILEVKQALVQKKSITPKQLRLFYRGRELHPDHWTVGSVAHNIGVKGQRSDFLHMFLPADVKSCLPWYGFQMFVRTMTWARTITLEVRSKMRVEELRAIIELKEGVEPDSQRLIFAGKQLADGRTLEDVSRDVLSHSSRRRY